MEIIDGLLRLGDAQAKAEALAVLAMHLGSEREPIEAVARELGLGALSTQPPSSASPEPSTLLDAEIARYLAEITSRHRELPLVGFQTRVRLRLSLEDLYVPLDAIVHQERRREIYADAADAAERSTERVHGEREEIALARAFERARELGRRGLILLGDPGSGKTTHLKQVLLKAVRDGSESLGLPRGLVPVFLPLRSLKRDSEGLWELVEQEIEQTNVAPGLGGRLRARGDLLLLIDGLDEVVDAQQRVQVSRWIEHARRSDPSCFFLVSSRYAGYAADVEFKAAFLELHLRPLDDQQMRRFVTSWYALVEQAMHSDPRAATVAAAQSSRGLLEILSHTDFTATARVYALTRNPLLLTAICLVHRDRGRLPRARAKLYEECVAVLLERWHWRPNCPLGADQAMKVLRPVAYWMHGEQGRTRATTEQLREPMQQGLSKLRDVDLDADEFLRTTRDESGLLTGWSLDEYGFMHLGFQEFLAARHLRNVGLKRPEELVALARRFGDSWWQEVILLMLAQDNPSVFEEFMRAVVRQPAFVQWANSSMMAMVLDEAAEPSAAPFLELLDMTAGEGDVVDLHRRQLAAAKLLHRTIPNQLLKPEIWDLLFWHPARDVRLWWQGLYGSNPGDGIEAPRGGVELVRIPGGQFMMGSHGPGRDDERPQHKVTLASFYLARTPVTNAQYGEYLKCNPGASKPEFWGARSFSRPDQPVIGISWHQAKAYCNWAGLSLPTEAQWEYACRAGTTTEYWSGDDEDSLTQIGWFRGNSDNRLHAVGELKENDFSLYDMHGNIWEWCEDRFCANYQNAWHRPGDGLREKPYGEVWRVVRGSSWRNLTTNARSAYRFYRSPVDYDDNLGFRPARAI